MYMTYPKILLRPDKEHILSHMHPWLFSMALQKTDVQNGAIADLTSSDGKRFLARGYFNGNSQIAFRILTRSAAEEINVEFFENRIRELTKVKQEYIDMRQTNAFRVVFGESDAMPGLIVDKYNKTFVIQIHTLGMEQFRKEIIEALKKVFDPETIYERSDIGVRLQEGMQDKPVGVLYGKAPPDEIEILENGISFYVNIKEGQKTGFFLDQRENRKALQKYVRGKRLLNCFCYSAGFSVYAALGGATETVNVDLSEEALETAKRNFELNGIASKKHQFFDKDVFKALEEYSQQREKFDVIILDPPAFVKNQKSLKRGLSGYLFINEKALTLLPPGGILVSSSCSAHVTDELFVRTLAMAASRSRCTLKTLEIKHQPIDHPFNVHFPEGKYLKFYVMLKS